jgi:phospholipase C
VLAGNLPQVSLGRRVNLISDAACPPTFGENTLSSSSSRFNSEPSIVGKGGFVCCYDENGGFFIT